MDDKSQQQIPKKTVTSPASVSEVNVRIEPSVAENHLVDTSTGSRLPAASVEQHSRLENFAKTVGEVSEAINNAAQSGKAVVEKTAQQTQQLIEQATLGAGQAVTRVNDNWFVRKLTGFLHLDWLFGATDRVDLEKAAAAVRKLQQEHPNESPSQIAHRIMVDKSIYAGGVGLVTSLVPGEAIALLAVDLATTTLIQAEMVYQIAAAYGLDLKDPARKGEVLGIFGLTFGGSRAIKAGLGLLRVLPVAGAVIGASANATMLYSLGYAACRFYEAKLNASTMETAKLAAVKEASENYLSVAIAQEAVMDQILVHAILASHPEKSWSEILPSLQALNLNPTSMQAIASNIKSPQPFDTLLNQLNRDFAFPLLAQCYRIAQMDGVTNAAEARVMKAIATKFDIDLNSIKSAVQSDVAPVGRTTP